MNTQDQGADNPDNLSEIDQLLKQAVERQEALKMPKPKPHWKQRRKTALERSRRHEAKEYVAAYRKAYRASMRGQWNKLRGEMIARGIGWELSYEDWVWMWTMAKPARMGGLEVAAWKARGKTKADVRIKRLNRKKPFNLNNLQIRQGDRVLWQDEM